MLLGFTVLGASFFLSTHLLPWTAFHNEIVAAAGALLIGVSALRGKDRCEWPLLAWVALGVALVPPVQWLAGLTLFRGDAILPALYLLTFALSVATGARLARHRRDDLLDGLAAVFMLVAVGSSLLAASQWFHVWLPLPEFLYDSFLYDGRAVANLGQPNHLAVCLVLGLVGAGWLHQQGKIRGGVLAAVALMLGFALTTTQSRAGWLLVAALVPWSWYARRRAGTALSPLAVMAFAASFFLMAAVVALSSSTAGAGPAHAVDVARGLSVEQPGRLMLWRYMVEALRVQPWFGYGWGELIVGVSRVATAMPPALEMPEYAHNVVLDLMMWNGVPLGLLLSAALAWWLLRHVARARDPAVMFALAAIGTFAIHAAVEFPYAYTYFLVPLGLWMGAVDVLSPSTPSRPMPRLVHVALFVVAVATGIVVTRDYVKIDADHRLMRMGYMGFEKVKSREEAPPVYLLDHMRAFLVLARTPMKARLSDEQLAEAARTVQRFPHPPLLLRFAVLAARHGHPEAARDSLDRLCKLHKERFCTIGLNEWREYAKGDPALQAIDLP